MPYDPCRRVHQILDDLAKPAAFHLPTGNIPFVYRHLSAQPQHIERHTESVNTKAFVANFPLGRRSSAISLFYFRMKLLAVP